MTDTRDHRARFVETLTAQYVSLFETDPEYAYSASRISPAALAETMTAALIDNTANHEGAGLRRTCKALGIKPTRTAMRAYLNTEV